MDRVKVYIELSDDLRALFAENNVGVEDVLRQEKIDVEFRYDLVPYREETEGREKDVALVILASSAVILAISTALSHIIETLYRKPYFVEYYDLEVICDGEGRPVTSRTGSPLLKMVKKHEFIEPTQKDIARTFDTSWVPSTGLVIRFSSKEHRQQTQSD